VFRSEPSAETRKCAPKPPRPALTPRIQIFGRGCSPHSALGRAQGTYESLIFRVQRTQQRNSGALLRAYQRMQLPSGCVATMCWSRFLPPSSIDPTS
jgi:hypothetical protein